MPRHLVNRHFAADAARRLWVADITHVATWSGFASVAAVAEVFSRRIVGRMVVSTLKAEILPHQALGMAAWDTGGDLTGLYQHSDQGSNYITLDYTDPAVKLGAKPSTGTDGDAYGNALAGAISNLQTAAFILQRGTWRTVEPVELATLAYVW